MSVVFNLSAFHHLVAIKGIWFLFLIVGAIFLYKNWKKEYFLLCTGLCMAGAYYFLVRGSMAPLWGFTGDELFITALFEMAAHGPGWTDFAYIHLPPFYPPLFFAVFGAIGRLLDLNGVQIMKVANMAVFLLFPLLFFSLQKWVWNKRGDKQEQMPGAVTWVIASLLLFALVDADAIILKQYEYVSAALTILWSLAVGLDIQKNQLTWKRLLLYGITGGILFLWFYFWLFFAAIAISLFLLFSKEKTPLVAYGKLAGIGLISFIIALPYLFPLFSSYVQFGAENWQLGFTDVSRLASLPFFSPITLRSIVVLVGMFVLFLFWKKPWMRFLLILFLTPYIWQFLGLSTILFFDSPLQEGKGFHFWNDVIIAIGFGYGVEQALDYFSEKSWFRPKKVGLSFLGLFLLSLYLIFGYFPDHPAIHKTLLVNRGMSKEFISLITYLNTKQAQETITLQSGISGIHAYVPLDSFIFFNIHESHPAAQFSERTLVLQDMERANDAATFYKLSQKNPFGPIRRMVFYKTPYNFYAVYLHQDNYPNGIKELQIRFPKKFFTPEYFTVAHESKTYVVFEVKK